MLEPGRVVASYEVQERVGLGGMAEVYRVTHRLLGSSHALKVLRPELAADPELRARFLAEGRVQAQIRHPHIAPVTDVVAEEGVAGLVMEYLEGGTLEARLARRGMPLSAAEAWEVLRPALDAVDALHTRGIVHRDLKTANLLFRDARWSSVVLSDFGIAHVEDHAQVTGARTQRTRTGLLLGTPAYMSPEQVRGQPVDARSDVFALGAIAWELLTLKTPFERDNDFDTMQAIVAGERPPLEVAVPTIPSAVAAVIERALATSAADRPGTAGALAWAWEEALRQPVDPPAARAATTTVETVVMTAPERSRLTQVPLTEEVQIVESPVKPAAKRRWGCGTWIMAFTVVVLLGGAAALGGVWWVAQQQLRSQQVAASALRDLQVQRTNPMKNDDATLDAAVAEAERAVAIWPTADALSARFLAVVWRQGWHKQGAAWDATAYQRADALYREAQAAGLRTSGQAGAAILTMARCQVQPEGDDQAKGCAALSSQVATAMEAANRAGQPWLVAELAWYGVRAARAQAGRTRDRSWLDSAEAMCAAGLPFVDAAPVNGRYLVQNCVVVSGHLGATRPYLARAHQLLAVASDADALQAIYSGAAPQCADAGVVTLGPDGRPKKWSKPDTGGWGDLCVYLGRYAEGCVDLAEEERPADCVRVPSYNLWGYPLDLDAWGVKPTCTPRRAKGVPWADFEAELAVYSGPRPACAIKR